MSSGQRQIKIMADKKLNELGTIESFDNAYVELSQNQYRISKTNLGKQLTNEVHTNFSVASSDPTYIYAQKSDGMNFRISKSDLTKAITNDPTFLDGKNQGNLPLYDGCFIMFHRQSDGWPNAVPYAFWKSLQNSGEEADGVLIVEGGHSLVVAPHEKSCLWSRTTGVATSETEYTSEARLKLLNIWNGRDLTRQICSVSSSPFYEESNNPSTKNDRAPGYCHNYTPHEISGQPGLRAGKYWLPCVAELMMIYTHKNKINAGLALINGANQISKDWYWSSTEMNDKFVWGLSIMGELTTFRKDNSYISPHEGGARPVSAFFHNGY